MADKIAGIDVHKKVLMVVVMDARTPESKLPPGNANRGVHRPPALDTQVVCAFC